MIIIYYLHHNGQVISFVLPYIYVIIYLVCLPCYSSVFILNVLLIMNLYMLFIHYFIYLFICAVNLFVMLINFRNALQHNQYIYSECTCVCICIIMIILGMNNTMVTCSA